MKFYTRYPIALVLVLSISAPAVAADPANSIYIDLTTKGVPLADGKTATLPKFTMDDGLTDQAQDTVIKNLLATDPNAPPLDKFMRNSVSASWFRVDTNIPNSTSHELDLYFIAYGQLQTVADGNFWKSRMRNGKNGKMDFLTAAQLKARNLKVIDQPTVKERYANADVELFEMVKVSGTARATETVGQESVMIAFLMDPSFLKDKQLPNEWRPITFDKNGKKKIGDPNPYDGVGAYSKITELKNTSGALFVEYHIIWDEPHGWFNGKPVMKSKLGDMIRNDVHSFREDLKLGPPAANQQAGAQGSGAVQPAPQTAQKSDAKKSDK